MCRKCLGTAVDLAPYIVAPMQENRGVNRKPIDIAMLLRHRELGL